MSHIHNRHVTLDTRQLNAFVTLVETGGFTAAARRLFLTHSAISHSIRSLEIELGCRLLNRLGKKVELTPVGEAFLFHVQEGLKSLSQARAAVEAFKQRGSQRFKIAAGAALSGLLFPVVLTRLRLEHPNILVTAKTAQASDICAALRNGDLEVAISSQPFHAPDLEFFQLFQAPMRAIVPSTHRWAALSAAPFNELIEEPCLLPEKSHPTRQLIDKHFAAEDAVLRCAAEIDSLDTVRELIRQGFGMGILPEWAVRRELAEGSMRSFPLGRKSLRQSWGFVRLRGSPVTSVETRFRVLCAEAAQSLRLTI